MLSKWSQAFSLAMLGLNVIRIAAVDTRSFGTDVDEAFGVFEEAVVELISDGLNDLDGILAQITMDYNPYAQ